MYARAYTEHVPCSRCTVHLGPVYPRPRETFVSLSWRTHPRAMAHRARIWRYWVRSIELLPPRAVLESGFSVAGMMCEPCFLNLAITHVECDSRRGLGLMRTSGELRGSPRDDSVASGAIDAT